MINDIGASAVRSLSVDIANLSARLAVQSAVMEHLMRLGGEIDLSVWNEMAVEEPEGGAEVFTAIPASQVESVRALLSALASVQ